MNKKPNLSFWQIWNLSFGFLGVQIGYSLQNANTSRIMQSLGADVHELSYFWLAAPLAGLFIQPIIGLFSDRTWTRLGRRIPFILFGAVLAAAALFLMPNAEYFATFMPALLFAAVMLLFMDMSFNITMQPFRALVADKLNNKQRTKGYAIQSFLINIGAVIGSVLPFVLVNWFGVNGDSTDSQLIPDSVAISYYIGGALLLGTVLVTTFTTKEYPPKLQHEYTASENLGESSTQEKPKFMKLLKEIPPVMWQLGVVQFFSWAALFMMWTYTTPAVAETVWGTTDTKSVEYALAGDWVGILFGVYSVFSAIFALFMVKISNKISNKGLYALSLVLGGIGFCALPYCTTQYSLFIPMIGIGVAWATILAMPYTILSKAVASERMGVYMGIFNFTITIPQIVMGLTGGVIVKYLFDGSAPSMLIAAGVCLLIGAIAALYLVKEKN